MHELPLKKLDLVVLVSISVIIYVLKIPNLGYLRIDAVALSVILFCLYRPKGMSLLLVFGIGLLQDIVSLSPIGQHALGLCLIAYLIQSFRDRIRIHRVVKQLPSIAFALLILKFVYSWIAALGFGQLPSLEAFVSVIFTALLWCPLVWVAERFTRMRKLPGISR